MAKDKAPLRAVKMSHWVVDRKNVIVKLRSAPHEQGRLSPSKVDWPLVGNRGEAKATRHGQSVPRIEAQATTSLQVLSSDLRDKETVNSRTSLGSTGRRHLCGNNRSGETARTRAPTQME